MIPQSATQPAPASPAQPDPAQPENQRLLRDQALPESRPVSPPAAPVVVLDTNVCLDLFVFHDPRWNALLEAMQQGRVRAVTRSDCRNEWQVVLGYRQLPLDEDSRAASMAAFDSLISCGEFPPMPGIVLPRCTDGDDQKFLELARDAKAAWLISKDKALLKLARKTAQAGLFRIGLPQTWLAAQSSNSVTSNLPQGRAGSGHGI